MSEYGMVPTNAAHLCNDGCTHGLSQLCATGGKWHAVCASAQGYNPSCTCGCHAPQQVDAD